MDNVYFAIRKHKPPYYDEVKETVIMMLLLESSEECTPYSVSEFARIYSLPTHKYNNDVNQFRRYKRWLEYRNEFIEGFTKYDDKYYMVADKCFYDYYSRYGFCSVCGILRCSPVWCICGHKESSNGWTSSNKQLDEFIKKSQLQTNSANDAYLEWIPFDGIKDRGYEVYLPIYCYARFTLTPLEITDKTDELCYDKVTYYYSIV